MISPIIAEVIELIKTAAAARSFTRPAFSWYPGEITSIKYSIVVLIISVVITKPMHNIIIIHSTVDTLKKIPETMTSKAIKRWIHALCCVLIRWDKPEKAYLKLSSLFFIENLVYETFLFMA